MFHIVYTKLAVKDISHLKSSHLDGKGGKLVEILREDPFRVPPRYEGLVGNLQGYFSRRINLQHRLVYQVFREPCEYKGIRYEGTVKIIRMWTHYE